MDLVIQIVNYRTKNYLAPLLSDIYNDLRNSKISFKILVLDNNSGDDLSDLKEKYKNINFFDSDKNLGFGGGHNFLSEKFKSDFILILNPDIKFIENNTIERALNFIQNQKQVAAIGPKLMSRYGAQYYDHGELLGFLAKICIKLGGSFWKNRNNISEVAWVSGAFLLINRSIFEKNNGFDSNFFLYEEEKDLCLRIRKIGYKIIYCPQIKVFHYGSVVASKKKFFRLSKWRFIKKWKWNII